MPRRSAKARIRSCSRSGLITVKLTRIDLHRFWMQLLQRFAAGLSDEVGAGAPPSHSSWPEPLSTDTLPLDEIASIGGSIAGYELRSPNDDASITRSPEAMANLQRRHGAPRQQIVGEWGEFLVFTEIRSRSCRIASWRLEAPWRFSPGFFRNCIVQPFNPEHIYPNGPVDLSPSGLLEITAAHQMRTDGRALCPAPCWRALVCGPVLSQSAEGTQQSPPLSTLGLDGAHLVALEGWSNIRWRQGRDMAPTVEPHLGWPLWSTRLTEDTWWVIPDRTWRSRI